MCFLPMFCFCQKKKCFMTCALHKFIFLKVFVLPDYISSLILLYKLDFVVDVNMLHKNFLIKLQLASSTFGHTLSFYVQINNKTSRNR